ncbi:hypothetical protein ABZ540_35895 [Nocardia xishanensis]|uniref:hypothetical protein n=1 Tax=Nocardia xishanensis TaxID=238964 RepID=UPI0033C65F92
MRTPWAWVAKKLDDRRWQQAMEHARAINGAKVWVAEWWRPVGDQAEGRSAMVWGRISCQLTPHRAHFIGEDVWVVDFLPGRALTRAQAYDAISIAAHPESDEVEVWAASLGMTAAQVLACAARWAGVSA